MMMIMILLTSKLSQMNRIQKVKSINKIQQQMSAPRSNKIIIKSRQQQKISRTKKQMKLNQIVNKIPAKFHLIKIKTRKSKIVRKTKTYIMSSYKTKRATNSKIFKLQIPLMMKREKIQRMLMIMKLTKELEKILIKKTHLTYHKTNLTLSYWTIFSNFFNQIAN